MNETLELNEIQLGQLHTLRERYRYLSEPQTIVFPFQSKITLTMKWEDGIACYANTENDFTETQQAADEKINVEIGHYNLMIKIFCDDCDKFADALSYARGEFFAGYILTSSPTVILKSEVVLKP